MRVPILKQGHNLIATIQTAPSDGDLRGLRDSLVAQVGRYRARGAIIDITGVPAMDANVANHLVRTVDASRLQGAMVIVTGLSPEIAQTLVTIGVDLSKMNTVGDLQGGIEEAERLLGYQVVPVPEARR